MVLQSLYVVLMLVASVASVVFAMREACSLSRETRKNSDEEGIRNSRTPFCQSLVELVKQPIKPPAEA